MTSLFLLLLLRSLAQGEPRDKRGIVPVHYGEGPIMTADVMTPAGGAVGMFHHAMIPTGTGMMNHDVMTPIAEPGLVYPVGEVGIISAPTGSQMMYGIGMHDKQVHDASNYYKDGKGYSDVYNHATVKDAFRDQKTIDNHGLKGYSGSHSFVDDKQGLEGFHKGSYGGNYMDGAGGYALRHNYHDKSAAGGFGGMGNMGHKKGHKTTGFHKSYHNEESGKDTEFVDEDHDAGEESFGNEYGDKFYDVENGGFEGSNKKGMYGEKAGGESSMKGGIKSFGGVDSHWRGRDRNGYYNNRDTAVNNYHSLANNNVNYGHKSYGLEGATGMHYHSSPYML